MFVAILDPAHRMIEFERERGEDDLFRIEPRLRAEAAADIGRDDADAAQLDAENFADRDAHRVRRLGRGVDHDLVEPVVAIGEDAAAFHRRAGLPVHAVFAGHGDRRPRARRLRCRRPRSSAPEQVVAEATRARGAGLPPRSRARIHHRVERLVVDRDGGGEVLGFGAGRRDAGGDRLADIAHLVGRERRPGRRAGARRLRHDPDRLDARQIGGGEYPAPCAPGGTAIERMSRMRVRAAQEHDLLGTAQRDVGDKLAAAAQVAIVLLAQHRRADAVALFRHRRLPRKRRARGERMSRSTRQDNDRTGRSRSTLSLRVHSGRWPTCPG